MEKLNESPSNTNFEQETILELKNEITQAIKICDNSEEFTKYIQTKLSILNNSATLSAIKYNLEKINAGLFYLSNSDSSVENTPEKIAERTKSIGLIIEGWDFIKKDLTISIPARIDTVINNIKQKHAN
jgi:DNA repair ATPase RecN